MVGFGRRKAKSDGKAAGLRRELAAEASLATDSEEETDGESGLPPRTPTKKHRSLFHLRRKGSLRGASAASPKLDRVPSAGRRVKAPSAVKAASAVKHKGIHLFKRKHHSQPKPQKEEQAVLASPKAEEPRLRHVSFGDDPTPSLPLTPPNRGKSRDSMEMEVSEQLTAFERGRFDLDSQIGGLDEAGLHDLREQLAMTKRECNEKIKRLLHQHYPAFIMASKGIRAMDGQVQELRALLNRENALLVTMKEIADPQGRYTEIEQPALAPGDVWSRSWADSPEGQRWNESMQKLDIAIAERRPVEALPLLKAAEKALLPGQKSGLYSQSLQSAQDTKTDEQAHELASRRTQLADLVTTQVGGLRLGTKEMQIATQVLASLSGRAFALKRHLEAHTAHLRKSVGQLLKPENSGGDADGSEFCNSLAQLVFGSIGTAADNVTQIFGSDLKDLAAIFLVWALSETEKCAVVMKRHALSPFAAPAGLGPTVACCLLACVHCSALQVEHGLRLSPRLMRDLWGACDQVLQRRLKRIGEDLKAAVAAEVDALVERGVPKPTGSGGWSDLMQVFPSADLLLDELEAVAKILMPLGGPRLREAVSQAFTGTFQIYTNAITAHFSRYRDAEGALPKELDDAVEPALEVAHSLVEQFLPDVAEPLKPRCGSVCALKPLYDQLNTFQDRLLPPEDSPRKQDMPPVPSLSSVAAAAAAAAAPARVAAAAAAPPAVATVTKGIEEDAGRWSDGEASSSRSANENHSAFGRAEAERQAESPAYRGHGSSSSSEGSAAEDEESDPWLQRPQALPQRQLQQPEVLSNGMQQPNIHSAAQARLTDWSRQPALPDSRPRQPTALLTKQARPSLDKQIETGGGDDRISQMADAFEEIEEMSEELSDYDENDIISQLTKKR